MIWLCIVSCTPALFREAAEESLKNASEPIGLCGLGNGCKLDFSGLPNIAHGLNLTFPENRGVVAALDEVYRAVAFIAPITGGTFSLSSSEDILVMIHDDFRILEKDWDKRVQRVFDRDRKCGLAGFGGSTALAGDEIYKKPYEVHQLGRRNFYSNMNGAEVHGRRVTEEMPIVFTDGQSMIVKRELLDKINGWSWWPFELVHHAYDYGIACQARRHGYTAWLVPCDVHHTSFQTASQPVYKDLADKYGGDAAVHDKAHRFVYEEFRDVLPLRL